MTLSPIYAAGNRPRMKSKKISSWNLAKNHPELFEVAHEYEFTDFPKAIQHASRPGKTGIVLLKRPS